MGRSSQMLGNWGGGLGRWLQPGAGERIIGSQLPNIGVQHKHSNSSHPVGGVSPWGSFCPSRIFHYFGRETPVLVKGANHWCWEAGRPQVLLGRAA